MIEIWNTSKTIDAPLYLNDAMPSPAIILGLQLLSIFLGLILLTKSLRRQYSQLLIFMLAICIQSYQYLHSCSYFDEVYVNLEHSWNLYHFNKFSFSPSKMTDATVELIYYLIISPFAWSHKSLITANIVLGLLITIAHTIVFSRLVKNTPIALYSLLMFGFAWNPVLAQIQGAGFGNGIVSLFYLIGFAAIWEDRNRLAGYTAIIMPLFRPDAILFSACLTVAIWIRQKKLTVLPVLGALVSTFIFHFGIQLLYGHWIPTPVLYKKTPAFEIIKGIPGLSKDFIYGLVNPYFFVLVLGLIITTFFDSSELRNSIRKENKILLRTQMFLLFLIYSFYIFSNRNTYAETRRYYMPFEYLGFLLILTEWELPRLKQLISKRFVELNKAIEFSKPDELIRHFMIVLSVFLILATSYSTLIRWKSRNFKFNMSVVENMDVSRENNFSMAAHIANQTIPAQWRIATTELQGFGFLTNLEIDPLFGYANREIAISPILNSGGRRIAPDYLSKSKPEAIWTGIEWVLAFPADLKPVNTKKIYQYLFNQGFHLNDIAKEYPSIFIIQTNNSRFSRELPRYGFDNTVFLIRSGNENEFRKSLIANGFQKAIEFPAEFEAAK